MNTLKFKRIIYLISATVMITVGIQVYRNIQNYDLNKKRFVGEVQEALDSSIEAYYADKVKSDIVIFSSDNNVKFNIGDSLYYDGSTDGVKSYLEARQKIRNNLFDKLPPSLQDSNQDDTVNTFTIQGASAFTSFQDTTFEFHSSMINGLEIKRDPLANDSLDNMSILVKKVLFSLSSQSINFDKMESFLGSELDRRDINTRFALWHYLQGDTIKSNDDDYELTTASKSTLLPRNQQLEVKFNNAALFVLKRGALDLLISLLISGAVIGSLLYLYRIINEQKELAEIKNDLISNITHEFKTPIATVSTAIEAISNFNEANDKVKTSKYLDMSSNQLQKLNGMVEKLLETASLNSDELELSKESIDVVKFTQQIFDKFQMIKGDKTIFFQTSLSEKLVEIDPFHMENAVSNLMDNAIKYGGQEITLKLSDDHGQVKWQVRDDGGKIDKTQQSRIFEQFYRIPTGNVHDVKGFGIGLYYTKKIVEKHEGKISLAVSENNTEFTIQI